MDAGKGTQPGASGGPAQPEPDRPVNVPPGESVLEPDADALKIKTTPAQIVIVLLGLGAFLYFARPVVLPVFLAVVGSITLKPFVRWGCSCHIAPAISATVLLGLLAAGIGIGFMQLGRPALAWMNDAPEHMTALRQRVHTMFPRLVHINEVAAAVTDLGVSDADKKEEQKKTPTVQIKDSRGTSHDHHVARHERHRPGHPGRYAPDAGQPVQAASIDNGSFMSLWGIYSRCQATTDLDQMRENALTLTSPWLSISSSMPF